MFTGTTKAIPRATRRATRFIKPPELEMLAGEHAPCRARRSRESGRTTRLAVRPWPRHRNLRRRAKISAKPGEPMKRITVLVVGCLLVGYVLGLAQVQDFVRPEPDFVITISGPGS